MNYIPVKEIADEWGLTVRRVQMMCMDGTIPGAIKEGKLWMVPTSAEKPVDRRIVTGAYKKSNVRKKKIVNKSTFNDNVIDRKFSIALSHDIRTSLNSIMGYSDMIHQHLGEDEKITEFANNISESGRVILRLLENTMLLARINLEEIKSNETVCSSASMLEDIIDSFRKSIDDNSIRVNMKFNFDHEFIYAEANMLHAIFENVIEHSIRFSKPSGIIKIKADELPCNKRGYVKFQYVIEDNGKGMTDVMLSTLNDSYYRNMNAINAPLHGTGLGLVIAKRFLDYLNGTILVESQFELGTRVTITMEHKIADFSEGEQSFISEVSLDEIKGKTILLAEDNEINRKMACEILREKGLNVECAEDGIICIAMLEKAEETKYDCILMDLQMPNMNGYNATQIIRSLDNKVKSQVPIIAMTASVLREDREKALRVGMNGFIEKPLDINRLLSIMQSAIDNKSTT